MAELVINGNARAGLTVARLCKPLSVAGALSAVLAVAAPAHAATVVALGASQTAGHGVSQGEDYPSQLQKMLADRGYAVSVKNAGSYNGETTAAMLSRLDGVLSSDTKVVIFQPGRVREGDTSRSENVKTIKQKLKARHVAFIKIPNKWFKDFPRQTDGQHLTANGYRQLAERLTPMVIHSLKSRD